MTPAWWNATLEEGGGGGSTFTALSNRFFGSGCALPKLLKCPASAFSVV